MVTNKVKAGGFVTRHGSKLLIAALGLAVLPMALKQHKSVAHSVGEALTSYATSRVEGPENLVETQHYILEKTWIDAPDDFGMGGAIEAVGDEVFLVTRLGGFHVLDADATAFRTLGWAPPAPVETEGFFTRRQDKATLGYQDFEIRTLETGKTELFLTETRVNPDGPCVHVRLHRAVVEAADLAVALPDWETVWTSNPCLPKPGAALPLQAGGEMTFLEDGRVGLFLGDFGNDEYNRRAFTPQADGNDYGKVIAVDPETGTAEMLSKGHRNPGGLTVGLDGRIWLAENAARGGDEINEIIPGQNYGWPVETYTTNYGLKTWPVSAANTGGFARPAFAFVPSPALSSMEVMQGSDFERWSGDLILGTLKDLSLFRVHVDEGDVVLTERIETGIRARDLTIGASGEIYVKADRRPAVLRIAPQDGAAPASTASILAQRSAGCLACHSGWSAVAPNLDGIVGRKVASYPGFDYSNGLKSVEGRWTKARLEAFLKDPESIAPGTLMPAVDMTDDEVDALIEALAAN